MVLAMKVGEEPDVKSSKNVGFSLDEGLFFFFRRSAKFGQTNSLSFSEDLFFLVKNWNMKNTASVNQKQSKN